MRSLLSALAGLLLLASASAQPPPAPMPAETLRFSALPSLPDPEGFAAPFAGITGGGLLVAGGANIVGEKWGATFTKQWYADVFWLPPGGSGWSRVGQLPHALGYGVSATWQDGVICAGGSDANQHFAECFLLRWREGQLQTTSLPSLPRPCANAAGVLVGDTLYVAGGLEKPTDTAALHTFWALHLAEPNPRWQELPPWPGPARMLAVTGTDGESFYLFSGASLAPGPDGKPMRTYLKDAYRYRPGQGWQTLAELPRAVVAAPSPAGLSRTGELLVISGDDGANVNFAPVEQHPGFPKDVLAYDPRADRWSHRGLGPLSRATVPTVMWQGRLVIPNGEVRPRVRTPEVWSLTEELRP